MKRYIFATDVDGTLLTDMGQIHPQTLDAFKKSQEQGHINVIATGRSIDRTKILLNLIPYIDYFVSNNGAIIYDVKNNKELLVHSLNPQHYLKMMDFYKNNSQEVTFKLHTNNGLYGFPEEGEKGVTIIDNELDQKIRQHIIDNPNDEKLFNGDLITQLSINGSEQFCKKVIGDFQKWFENDSSVYLTNSIYIDVNPKNVSKWTGLVELASKLNIPENQIVTFGDSGNDYDMLFNAKENGYPLANSKIELKEKIEPKIGSNNTGAIGETILKYLNKN